MTRHQRTVKYCLAQQGTKKRTFNCSYCDKIFYREDNLLRHEKKYCTEIPIDSTINRDIILIEKIMGLMNGAQTNAQQQTNEIMKQMLNMLETKESIKKNPADDLQPITDKDLLAYLDNLSLDFIQRGVKGYADYAGSYPFRGKVICTDRSRKKIQYKNEDGSINADGQALAQRFFQAISEKNTILINQEYSELHKRLDDIVANNSAGEEDVADILKRASFIQDLLIKTQNAAAGLDNDFTQLFLAHLSKTI